MKLLRMQARNFRCFEHLELNLDVNGLVAVVGDNGAGKSTIFTAIEWALYGGRGALPARRDSPWSAAGSTADEDGARPNVNVSPGVRRHVRVSYMTISNGSTHPFSATVNSR